MIVCIAEKPSVARDIADVLGAKDKKDGYIEGNGYQVTWTFGHLCTLKEPHEYTPNWKSWSLGSLPMVPPRFGIKLISNPTYERQFHVIENLMQHADMIINCGDAGQEGELIQRWVMQKAGARCPVKRLWISSLTEEAIREGFAKLRDASDFQPLYEAGLSRAIGDWLLGVDAPPPHKTTKTTKPAAKPDQNNLGFGKIFTDHMFVMNYTEGQGWHDARIVPFEKISLSPAAMVFHYGQEMFEGMKAYRGADGKIYLFRPDMNAKRANNSNTRLCIPHIDENDFVEAVKAVVSVDKDWIPTAEGTSLYIRPFIIATDEFLGVAPSKTYLFFPLYEKVTFCMLMLLISSMFSLCITALPS